MEQRRMARMECRLGGKSRRLFAGGWGFAAYAGGGTRGVLSREPVGDDYGCSSRCAGGDGNSLGFLAGLRGWTWCIVGETVFAWNTDGSCFACTRDVEAAVQEVKGGLCAVTLHGETRFGCRREGICAGNNGLAALHLAGAGEEFECGSAILCLGVWTDVDAGAGQMQDERGGTAGGEAISFENGAGVTKDGSVQEDFADCGGHGGG